MQVLHGRLLCHEALIIDLPSFTQRVGIWDCWLVHVLYYTCTQYTSIANVFFHSTSYRIIIYVIIVNCEHTCY